MEPHLLIADDDEGLARMLKRFYARRHRRPITLAHSVADALALIESDTPWGGAVFDFHFPDGDGLALLEAFCRRSTAPTMMLTASNDLSIINRVTAFDTLYAVKPPTDDVLEMFASKLAEAEKTSSAVERAVAALSSENGLTEAELRLLTAITDGVQRDDLPARLGVADSTIKTQIRSLAHKLGGHTLADVLRAVIDRAGRH
jgi:DNA-binding NarL/FixJ family response regulator